MCEHKDSWLQFGQQHPDHEIDWSVHDLIFVTGVDLCMAFDTVVYSKSSSELNATFKIDIAPLGHADMHIWEQNVPPEGHWDNHGTAHTLADAVRNNHTSIARPPPSDPQHSLFLRGWRLRPRSQVPKEMKAAAGPHELGSPPPPSDPTSPCRAGDSQGSDEAEMHDVEIVAIPETRPVRSSISRCVVKPDI
jgi:hypothetical protein